MFIFYLLQTEQLYFIHCTLYIYILTTTVLLKKRQTDPLRLYRQDTTVNISLPTHEQTVFSANSLQQNTQISTDFFYWSETVLSLHCDHKWEVIKTLHIYSKFLYSTVVIFSCSGHNGMFSGFTETTAAWQSVQEHWAPSPLNNASAPVT